MRGSVKWYWQRLTALILVPTTYWFVIFFLNNLNSSSENLLISLDNIFSKLLMIIFFSAAVFHARLGLVTIYEDYFKDKQVKVYSRITDILLLLVLIFILPIIFI
jgi:succinate dehydrogenase / fumarate reductase membrane anchor subunit